MMNADTLQFPVGIELETGDPGTNFDFNRVIPGSWSQGVDGSAGLEFRSGKLEKISTLINDTPILCRTAENHNCWIHSKCGMHVHVGFSQVADLSAKYRLFRFASVYENLFLDLFKPWDDRANYCRPLPLTYWAQMRDGQGFKPWKDSDNRYWWLNGKAMDKYGTVEFRLHNGTLDPNVVLGWVSILQCAFNATVTKGLKLAWNDTGHATVANLIADIQCDTTPIFGQRAKAAILAAAKAAKSN